MKPTPQSLLLIVPGLAFGLVPCAAADIVWTGAVSADIFEEGNWDFSNSTVTAVDPNVSITDDVVIRGAPQPVEIPAVGGGQFRFQVGEGFRFTIDNSTVTSTGDDGVGSDPGTGVGITIDVINGAVFEPFFVVNEVVVEVDATSTLTFGGGGNPVNLSRVDLTFGAVLGFLLEDPTEFTMEHLSKVSVDGLPAVVGGNITVASDGAMGSIITVLQQTVGQNYCSTAPNSTMLAASMSATGSVQVSANDITLECAEMPAFVFGFFIASRTQGFVMNPGMSDGNLCLGGSIGRYVGAGQIMNTGGAGSISLTVDLQAIPQPNGPVSAAAGDTWNFQCWFRDAGLSGTGTSNFSDGLSITF